MILRILEVLGILAILSLLILVCVAGSIERVRADIASPLNFVMFREPSRAYEDSLVSYWVRKPWKTNGERIPCYRVDRPGADIVLLYAHGNASNLADCAHLCQALSEALDATVVTFDYSGYGLNAYDAYERTADGVNETLKAVFEDLRKEFPRAHFVLYGFSLGAGPVLNLAATLPDVHVIVHGAFTSIRDMVKLWVQHDTIQKAFSERWDNRETIAKLKSPLMIMHAENDQIVPHEHGKELSGLAKHSRFVTLSNSGHSDYDVDKVAKGISEFLRDSRQISA